MKKSRSEKRIYGPETPGYAHLNASQSPKAAPSAVKSKTDKAAPKSQGESKPG